MSRLLQYSNEEWTVVLPHVEDDLPRHIKGHAQWVEDSEEGKSCYQVKEFVKEQLR